jgi:hypothetical protein
MQHKSVSYWIAPDFEFCAAIEIRLKESIEETGGHYPHHETSLPASFFGGLLFV